jgi:hypothetical protein
MPGSVSPVCQAARMEQELRERMEAFQAVVLERDQSLAEDVLDEDYALMLVQPSPAVMPRSRWLDVLPDYVVDDYEVLSESVDADEDTAAVLSLVRMDATVLGEDRSGLFVVSDVWRRRPDGWRVWRRHSTPVSAGRMPGAE